MKINKYDVIVVGAGHAGCEAALAAARLGCKALLITMSLDKVALMPCNPAVGGIGKGQLVKEIDALGGEMGRVADRSAIQIKVLNKKKGPAVRALRAQTDKTTYESTMKSTLELQPGLHLRQATVSQILLADGSAVGVRVESGQFFEAQTVVVTTGTFLKGEIVIGDITRPAGRMGECAAGKLSRSLLEIGLELGRFQSATPPRADRRSLNFNRMTPQLGEADIPGFSLDAEAKPVEQMPCYLTYTTRETHQTVQDYLHLSPLKTGTLSGHGPRNCPSIDRKIINFPDKDSHPVFVEPEGRVTSEMYLQGLTTSLPVRAQEKIVRSVPGLEKAELTRPGYAVAYDFVYPDQLCPTLETKAVPGLFTAGQINGTSGYEEAAAQGLVAGINAALKVKGKPPFILDRSQAYIGVLIDDLVTKGVDEPYRIFTSRAEHRLLLRSDNADLRLVPIGHKLGLVPEKRHTEVMEKERRFAFAERKLRDTVVGPSQAVNRELEVMGSSPIKKPTPLSNLLKRPELDIGKLAALSPELAELSLDLKNRLEVELKYEGYVKRQKSRLKQHRRLESKTIPGEIDYHSLSSLSIRAREKLSRVKPRSLGQAARVSGVTASDVSVLAVHLERLTSLGADNGEPSKKTD